MTVGLRQRAAAASGVGPWAAGGAPPDSSASQHSHGCQVASLAWRAARPGRPTHGLLAEYFDGYDGMVTPVMTRIDPAPDFDWSRDPPAAGFPKEMYGVRWRALFDSPFDGLTQFCVTSDDGVRLWIDDTLVLEKWIVHPPSDTCGNIALVAGRRYRFRLDYFQRENGAVVRAYWRGPQMRRREIIPPARFLVPPDAPVP